MTKQWIRVKATGEEYRVDRIDNHTHSICANYQRWNVEEVELFIRKEDYPALWKAIDPKGILPENQTFNLPDLKDKKK